MKGLEFASPELKGFLDSIFGGKEPVPENVEQQPVEIEAIEINGVRYLTSARIAKEYGTDIKIIANNFNRNKERYEEGKHFICLQGAELKEFKTIHHFDEQFKHTTKLYLWTERGAFLHAKSLNTEKAWDTYEKLVEIYFRATKAQATLNNLSPQTQAMINLEVRQNELKKRVDNMESRLEQLFIETAEPEPEPVPQRSEPKKWSEREKDYLRKAYALGQSDVEIAADLNRTIDSIASKRRVLGLSSVGARHWTKEEDKKLRRLLAKGLTAQEIAKIMNRSAQGVYSRKKKFK